MNEHLKKNLTEHWETNVNTWQSNIYLTPIVKHIAEYLNDKHYYNSLLDFGCGYGKHSNAFSKFGFNVTGVDSSLERIAKARSDFPNINFVLYNFERRLPFENNSFDIVYTNSVLQYVEHECFLNECERVLKSGGSVIFVENLKNNPITRLGRGLLKLVKHDYQSYPWNHFTFSELYELKNRFANSSIKVFHILSPLAHLKLLRSFHSIFSQIDNFILSIPVSKRIAWLALFIGKRKKH